MGSEIIFPLIIGLKWGLIIFLCLSLIYALIFRFRNASAICPTALRTILYAFVALLLVPSAICALGTFVTILMTLTVHFEPPSDRYIGLGLVVFVDGIVVGAWWGLAALFRHLDKALALQP
jgi:hypothetical protein